MRLMLVGADEVVYQDAQGCATKGANNFSWLQKLNLNMAGQSIPIDKIVSGSEGSFWSNLANKAPLALNSVADFYDSIFANGYLFNTNLVAQYLNNATGSGSELWGIN